MRTIKIKSIKQVENTSLLYDIEISKTKCFFANDVLVHNSSIACAIKDNIFHVAGREIDYKRPEAGERINSYWSTALAMDIEAKMRDCGIVYGLPNFAIQGELVGEGIQGNIYKLKGKTIRFYNAYDIDYSQYFDYEMFLSMLTHMRLHTVPILDADFQLPETVDELLKEADAAKTIFGLNPDQLSEGRVYIAHGNVKKIRIQRSPFNRLSFKCKSRKYDKNK